MRDGNVKSSAETGLRFRQSLNPFWFQKLSNHPKFHSLLNRNVENIANVLLEVFHAEEAIMAHRNSRYQSQGKPITLPKANPMHNKTVVFAIIAKNQVIE